MLVMYTTVAHSRGVGSTARYALGRVPSPTSSYAAVSCALSMALAMTSSSCTKWLSTQPTLYVYVCSCHILC